MGDFSAMSSCDFPDYKMSVGSHDLGGDAGSKKKPPFLGIFKVPGIVGSGISTLTHPTGHATVMWAT